MGRDGLTDQDFVVGTGTIVTIDADNVFYCLLCCGISGQQFCANWIIFNGTKYRPRQTLFLSIDDDMPVFC